MTAQHVLYVEDDEDIRDTMTMLLEYEGYHVTATSTAEAALEALARTKFDLLLTDYQLPGENAAWLLATADERGLLGDTPVIVLSGAYDPPDLDGRRLLRKPVRQEVLFAAFDDVMPKPAPTASGAASRGAVELRLTLYVSGASAASRKAVRNLGLVLRGVDPSRVELVVHDISTDEPTWAAAAEEDRIVVIPTLVRYAPLPKVWVAGDLSATDQVRDAVVPPSLLPG